MKFGVVVFPGSNCDHDAWYAVSQILGHPTEFIWHDTTNLGDVDARDPARRVFLWRLSALRRDREVLAGDAGIRKFAADGGLVLGICNGFQILVESGLLPGALLRNRGLKFICKQVPLRSKPPTRRSPAKPPKASAWCLPDRPWRGLLHRRRAHARSARSRRPRRHPLSRQPQRIDARHRRHAERRPQRHGTDAASGTRHRAADGLHRRPRDFQVHGLTPWWLRAISR